jgi:hypothetical protein
MQTAGHAVTRLADQLYSMQVSTLQCLHRLQGALIHLHIVWHDTVFLCRYDAFKRIQYRHGTVIGLSHYDPFSFMEKA